MSGMRQIIQFDHTADIGIRVSGKTLEDVFLNAVIGMFEVILGSTLHMGARRGAGVEEIPYPISLASDSTELLLHDWMSELLFIHARDHVIFVSCTFGTLSETSLSAEATFIPLSEEMISQATEIKAVTYHDLLLRKTETGFEAQIIFDM